MLDRFQSSPEPVLLPQDLMSQSLPVILQPKKATGVLHFFLLEVVRKVAT
jgi:hypothetical protein